MSRLREFYPPVFKDSLRVVDGAFPGSENRAGIHLSNRGEMGVCPPILVL